MKYSAFPLRNTKDQYGLFGIIVVMKVEEENTERTQALVSNKVCVKRQFDGKSKANTVSNT